MATPKSPSPHADDDDALINGILNGDALAGDVPGDFSFGDTVGKVADAVDYEDISDDDLLPEEEEPVNNSTNNNIEANDTQLDEEDAEGDELFDLMNEGEAPSAALGDELDDLFGDMDALDDSGGGGGELDMDMSLDFGGVDVPASGSGSGGGIGASGKLYDDEAAKTGATLFKDIDFGMSPGEMMESTRTEQELVKQYFPDFEPHKILSFNSLFKSKPATLSTTLPKAPKICVPTKINFEMAPDDSVIFSKGAVGIKGYIERDDERRGRIIIIPPQIEEIETDDEQEEEKPDPEEAKKDASFERDLVLACDDWDSKIEAILATPPPSPPAMAKRDLDDEDVDIDVVEIRNDKNRPEKRVKIDQFLDSLPDSWLDEEAIFNGNLTSISAKVTLDLNDPYLLVDIRQPNEIRRTRKIGGEFKRRVNKDLTQRYNISNDEAYDLLKENHQNKVRSTIGQLNIEHSMPALRLQSPYYKTKLSIKEARSFHRPSLHFHVNQEIRFSKIKSRKKKTYRGKDIQTVLATTKDISLMDNCNFILLEYSEEYPTVMSNFGMGSRLINYYRRKGPDDESRPKYDIGETQVLMSQDRSPFWNFGTVDPGETVPTLYNRMSRAPIFKQAPKSTDFVVIRNTHDNQSHYFLRTIPHVYVVGQLLPVTDVPGPHSRKVTTAAKNRLKMVCYRVVKRKEGKAIAVKDISAHFPENNDLQNRQKIKEFMGYQKSSGLWEMKPGEVVPDEPAIRAMVKPEDLCLLEAMQVGVRNLADAGYAKTVEDEEDDDKDGMSLETQLTPWVSTKNFINATQGKAMLQLHGEGDPSGRGEAFSFVRTSMKGGFKAVGESVEEKMDKARLKELGGHSYNVARQQRQYEEAIDQIWRSQHRSLSSTEPPDLEIEDAQRDEHVDDLFEEGMTPRSQAVTPGGPSPWLNPDDETMSQFSRFSATNQRNKVLKIIRRVRNDKGDLENKVELVTDPKVIRQYLQRRRDLEAEKTQVENIVPTGNDEEDQRNKKRLLIELQRLQRNKERREARERQGKKGSFSTGDVMSPEATTPGSPMTMMPVPGKTATTRKCANCGQAGHIRTNKKLCPKLNGTWAELGMSPPAPAGTPTGS